MDSLSILLSAGQLLGLPVVVCLVVTGRFTIVPPAVTIVLVVHFAPYSWLYATPLYLVMGGVLSVAAVIAMGSAGRGAADPEAEVSGAERVCLDIPRRISILQSFAVAVLAVVIDIVDIRERPPGLDPQWRTPSTPAVDRDLAAWRSRT